jgi:hypothetical protein
MTNIWDTLLRMEQLLSLNEEEMHEVFNKVVNAVNDHETMLLTTIFNHGIIIIIINLINRPRYRETIRTKKQMKK